MLKNLIKEDINHRIDLHFVQKKEALPLILFGLLKKKNIQIALL